MRLPFGRRGHNYLRVTGLTTEPIAVADASHPQRPGHLFVADVAVAFTGSGRLCLAAVLDAYSRYCVGWATGGALRPELLIRAARAAVPARSVSVVALALASRCAATGIDVDPEATPGAMDGAVTHTFFKLLRQDLAGSPAWGNRTAAAEAVTTWIAKTYNPYGTAPHSEASAA